MVGGFLVVGTTSSPKGKGGTELGSAKGMGDYMWALCWMWLVGADANVFV